MSFKFNAARRAVNAALVGANTVNVAVDNVAGKLGSPPGADAANVTAFTKESSLAETAVFTMFPVGGSNTPVVNLWITPFDAAISACATFNPLMNTPFELRVTKTESPPAVTTLALGPAGTSVETIFCPIVWYKRIALASDAESPDRTDEVIPAAVNASLFGANTVNDPAPLSVVASPAFATAALNVLNSVVVVTT